MNKKNLEILGLGENATVDEIKTAYENLRERYLEERFKDGEVGNNAARMLTRIETAYNDLMSEIGEASTMDEGGDMFGRVEQYERQPVFECVRCFSSERKPRRLQVAAAHDPVRVIKSVESLTNLYEPARDRGRLVFFRRE